MKYLKTKHQRKSALLTIAFMTSILMLMLFFGMSYIDPPEEYGVAINFGTSDFGDGPPKVLENVKTSPESSKPKQEVLKKQEVAFEKIEEKVITQNTEDAPVIQKNKVIEKEISEPQEKPKKVVNPVVKEAPKPSKETENALSNLLNGNKSDGDPSKGEGDDDASGLKGNELGDPSSSNYYGNSGSGEGGNYDLGGRKPLGRPTISPDCNEEGIVVVRIEVDRNGIVVKAVPGVKGSENTSPCLLKPAKEAALRTRWNSDGDAPSKQIGYIKYNFTLSE